MNCDLICEVKTWATKWPEFFPVLTYSVLEFYYKIKKKKWLIAIIYKSLRRKKTMKTAQIIKEELKKAFPTMSEEALESGVVVVCEKIAPRLALEADEAAFKMIGTGIVTVYPLLKPALGKLTDLDKDGN